MNTPEWNMAMINLLLSLKDKGHKINEVEADKVRWRLVFDPALTHRITVNDY